MKESEGKGATKGRQARIGCTTGGSTCGKLRQSSKKLSL